MLGVYALRMSSYANPILFALAASLILLHGQPFFYQASVG